MGSLSGISQVLSPILSLTGVPGAIVGAGTQYIAQKQARDELRMGQDVALSQLKEKQALDENTSAQNIAIEKARLAAEAATAEDRRKAALRRAVARQKTLFSAQGLGGTNAGSNEAVLLGLYNDSEGQGQSDAQINTLRTTALDQSLAQQKQKNLLEVAQLSEKQNLTRVLSGY